MRNLMKKLSRPAAVGLAVVPGLLCALSLRAGDTGSTTENEKLQKALRIAAELEEEANRLQNQAALLASEADSLEQDVPAFDNGGTVALPKPKASVKPLYAADINNDTQSQDVAASATLDDETEASSARNVPEMPLAEGGTSFEADRHEDPVGMSDADLAKEDGSVLGLPAEHTATGTGEMAEAEIAEAALQEASELVASNGLDTDENQKLQEDTAAVPEKTETPENKRSFWSKLFRVGETRREANYTEEDQYAEDISAMSSASSSEDEKGESLEEDIAVEQAAPEEMSSPDGMVMAEDEPTAEDTDMLVEEEATESMEAGKAALQVAEEATDAVAPSQPVASPDIQKHIETLRFSQDYREQARARDALIAKGPAVTEPVIGLLNDTRSIVRTLSIIVLRETKGAGSYLAMYELLGDSDPQIRYHADMALVKMTGRNVGYHFNDIPKERSRAMSRWWDTLLEMKLVSTDVVKKQEETAKAEAKDDQDDSGSFRLFWWRKTEEEKQQETKAVEDAMQATPWWEKRLQASEEGTASAAASSATSTPATKARVRIPHPSDY